MYISLLYIYRIELRSLLSLIDDLRAEGSDTAEVEVKAAADGFPSSLASTLSAFANTPGGGTIVLGLDESEGFAACGVYDAAATKAALASLARQAATGPRPARIVTYWSSGTS